jgi:hypothetical protein
VLFPTSWPSPRPIHTLTTSKHSSLLIMIVDGYVGSFCTVQGPAHVATIAEWPWRSQHADFIMGSKSLSPTHPYPCSCRCIAHDIARAGSARRLSHDMHQLNLYLRTMHLAIRPRRSIRNQASSAHLYLMSASSLLEHL